MLQLLAIVDPFDNGGTSSPWAMKLPDKKRGLEIQAEWPCRERERERGGGGGAGGFIKMQSLLSLFTLPAETIKMVQSNLNTSL